MCIGAPVRDWNNNVIAAISVSGLKSRMVEMGLETVKGFIFQATAKITLRTQSREYFSNRIIGVRRIARPGLVY